MPASLTEGNTMHHPARSLVLLGVAFSLITGSAHAERWLVPAGAHVTGAQDTNWRTDLQVSNPSGVEATITVYLLEAREDNSSLARSSSHTVPAGGQIVIGDVFEADFSFSGNGGLLVESSNVHLVVTSRTYNLLGADNALELPEGATFGQFIPGVNVDDALDADVEGHIVYLARSDAFRSNLGFCAATATGGRATVTMYAEDGAETGSVSRSFDGFEQYQWNDIFGRTGSPDSTAARAVIVADAPIVAYGSVVDERTGDPVAVMAETAENVAFTDSAIAAAARVEGLADTLWRTDIRIFNPGSATATVTLDYRRKGRSGRPQESTTVTVGAGAVLPLDDAMMEAFGLEEANGGIDVTSDVAVATYSRTYNQTPSGTFGQSIPTEETGRPLAEGEARIYNGLNNTGFRSNAGFFNLDSEERTVTLTVVDDGGNEAGSGDIVLDPHEMNQITDVFDEMGIITEDNGSYSLLIEFVGDVLSYVSIVDDLSGDPVFQPGEPREPGRGLCVEIPLPASGTVATYDIPGGRQGNPLGGDPINFWGSSEVTYISATTSSGDTRSFNDIWTVQFGNQPVTEERTVDYLVLDEPAGYAEHDRVRTFVDSALLDLETIETFAPALLFGPLTEACAGDSWASGQVSHTSQIVGGDTTTESYTWEGEVLAVDAEHVSDQGTRTAVHWRAQRTSGDGAGMGTERMYDVETGILLYRLDWDVDGTTVLLEQEFTGFGTN
jgi:hypothetical protein